MGKRVTILLATFALAIGLVLQPYADAVAAGMPLGSEAAAATSEPVGGVQAESAVDQPEAADGSDAVPAEPAGSELSQGGRSQEAPFQAPPLVAQAVQHDDVIDSISAVLENGSGPATSVAWDQVFRLEVAFSLPDGQVHSGDTTVIELPDELKFYQLMGVSVPDSLGNIVAYASLDGAAKTVTVTFSDYPESHFGVNGKFFFYVRVDHSVVTTEQDIPLVFKVGNATIDGGTIHSGAENAPVAATTLLKSSWQSTAGNPRLFNHTISVNRTHERIDNAVLKDEKRDADTYLPTTMVIKKGNWVLEGSTWVLRGPIDVTDQYPVEWAPDGKSFSIRLGNIAENEGFFIDYKTEALYPPGKWRALPKRCDPHGFQH